ncbi:hypothetical protein [Hugenholtzia roseola]|uniref:hypothetical protein n=1 Tax=Hugenholtzia roseola TaxID=1002 RepID=UPI000417A2E6|nr:hypothetical protein [Hugenholtzia roseola]
MKYSQIREEELKNKVAETYFAPYDCTRIVGNIDFCVLLRQDLPSIFEAQSLLWAEAKKGTADPLLSLTQLILTIGKARTFDIFLPPAFLGAFDAEKIAFIPYNEVQDIFYLNDFNWNVTPSNYDTKEFKLIYKKVKDTLEKATFLFYYEADNQELEKFIAQNFVSDRSELAKIRIDKNNFISIYNKWLKTVKPTIAVNWDLTQKVGIIDGDFYLADLLSKENETLKDKLFVLLRQNIYELDRKIDELGMFSSRKTAFNDQQKAHAQFWNKYERPPSEAYWDYIVARRDLLVPQDIRERKGSFFTPQMWVELSQKYLSDLLGEDWQDEYYIWDCAAGTGNLLTGLTNKYHIWASTLDKQDVDVMHDRIKNGANLLEQQVFQFDFLNDDFSKLPQNLQEVLNNPNKRKKLIIYINPPYAEAPNKDFTRLAKKSVQQSKTNEKYANLLGQGNRELFAQFLTRIYQEIPDCIIAHFSTLKILKGQHFINFRTHFLARLEKLFVMPADTFDNVKGKFPIGFFIWDTAKKEKFEHIVAEVYDKKGKQIGHKNIESYANGDYINDWVKPYRADVSKNQLIGKFPFMGNDFQHQNAIQINHHQMIYNKAAGQFFINQKNVLVACVYFAVRKCIAATWLNDRDQFLHPNPEWEEDKIFQHDCLVYTLFKNNIQSKYGTNHWIPFTEKEVEAPAKFESDFMARYLAGKVDTNISTDLFHKIEKNKQKPLVFSKEATQTLAAGRELWKYYQAQPHQNVNASFYDIRAYFQGRNQKGKMNSSSEDETYHTLLNHLRHHLDILAMKIALKVYEYGFLKR